MNRPYKYPLLNDSIDSSDEWDGTAQAERRRRMDKEKVTFEEVFRQNERRVHYHIHRLNINDPHQEFYQEGMVAMWNAYEKYDPDLGPMATYFNYMIKNRLIDSIRKERRQQERDKQYSSDLERRQSDGNYKRTGSVSSPVATPPAPSILDEEFWSEVKRVLTENQWKWVKLYIIDNLSQREIADREGVSVEAVKSWAKEARKKLRSHHILHPE